MSIQSDNNKRLAKNTLLLYGRMFLTVGISFYSTRLILANLGVDNYGIYNVIGGFVSMFYMISATMTQAVIRFLTYELGAGNEIRLKKTFSTSINVLLVLSLIVVAIAETLGLWFVNNQLNISPERMNAANWIYQFSVLSFIFEMISVPYSASVISHEKMGIFALVTIIKVLLTFGIALLLSVSPIDNLIFYGILVLLVSILIQLIYWIYCKRTFMECRYSFHIDKGIFKNMFGFAGWNFLTSTSTLLSSQGVNIILNMYFGTSINAARGIASQINGTVGAFSKNFMTSLAPQITKSYAANELDYTKSLLCRGAKFSYLLLFVIALPCMIEINFLLSIWLKEVPTHAGIFAQLTLLFSLTDVLTSTSETLIKATGKIKKNQILLCISQYIILLTSYLVINLTKSPILTVAIYNVVYIIIFVPRIVINKPFIGMSFFYFYKNVLYGIIVTSLLSAFFSLIPVFLMESGWNRLILVCLISTISILFFSYNIVFTKSERKVLLDIIRNKLFRK